MWSRQWYLGDAARGGAWWHLSAGAGQGDADQVSCRLCDLSHTKAVGPTLRQHGRLPAGNVRRLERPCMDASSLSLLTWQTSIRTTSAVDAVHTPSRTCFPLSPTFRRRT